MGLKIDRVQLQFEIKPDYDQQQLQKLEDDLKKANRELSKTEREIEKVRKQKPSDPAAYAKWKKDLDELNRRYQQQVGAVQAAQRAIDKHVDEMKLENLSMAQLTKRAQTLNTILRNMNPNSPAYAQYKKQLDAINLRIRELRGQAVETRLSLSKLADGFNRYSMLVGSAIASMTGLTLTIRKCTNAYAEMEDVMANVRKYTGQTDEQVREMNEDFKKMDTRSSREQLNALAGAAGRLGLTAKADIMAFVDGADKIGVALGDDLGEGAVDTIGKLAIAFGESDRLGLRGAMLATGSALNEIVQNSPAQAQPVVEFTEKLSGVGQQAHMTQAQIVGFASALDQNNQEMATSSTVMSQLITKMYKDPARFANMAGMEVKKFADLMKNDMNAALIDWLQHVNKLGDMSVLAGKFDELKMDGTRAVGVLSTLAGHVDQVVEAQRIATEAYEEGTSVINEFNVQNSTVAAELDKAKKRFADLTIELGQKLLPIARRAITGSSAGIRVLSSVVDGAYRFRSVLGLLAAALVAYNAVLAISWAWKQRTIVQQKAMYALEALQNTLTNARTVATAAYNVVMGRLTGNLDRATVAQAKLNTAMSANVVGAIVAAVVVLVAVLKSAYNEITKLDAATQALNEVEKDARDRISDERTEMNQLVKTIQSSTTSENQRKEALEKLNGKLMQEHLGNLTEEEIRTGKAQRVLDQYNASMMQRIKNEVLLEKLKDAQRAHADAEAGDFDIGWIDRAKQIGFSLQAFWLGGASAARQAWANTTEALRQKTLDDSQATIDALMKQWEENNVSFTIYDPGDHSSGKKSTGDEGGQGADGGSGKKKKNKKGGDQTKKLIAEKRKQIKEEEELAKAARQKADLEAKQEYQQQLITEEEYHDKRYQNEQTYIAAVIKARENQFTTESEKQEAQNMLLDSIIDEANYQREQKQKKLQETLSLMAKSFAADQTAIEEQWRTGQFATEDEYNQKKIEAEIDYQRERLRIIKAAGGDTQEAEQALNQALMKKFSQDQAERQRELEKELKTAELSHDYDKQLEIQRQLLDAKLINQLQYEEKVTAITKAAEQERQKTREAFAQEAGQLLQGMSSLFSAIQSREENRVDAKYKKLIDAAKKQGKDTTKLEEAQEAEKMAIKKKYADKQFAMTVLQVIANAAQGISKIWAEWGWNPPVAIGLTATESAVAAIQLATAKAQREQAAGLYGGGYNDEYAEGFTGAGDPKKVAGVIPVHKREFVINHEALQVPAIRRVANVIDSMQKRKVYSLRDTARELQMAISMGGLVSGGYSLTQPERPSTGEVDAIGTSRLERLMERNNNLLDELIDSGITILQLRKEIRKQEQLERNASR